jgi:hypothetical protein
MICNLIFGSGRYKGRKFIFASSACREFGDTSQQMFDDGRHKTESFTCP